MRLLLTLMAMAVLVVSIGCDKKEEKKEEKKEAPATSSTSTTGADQVAAQDAGDGSATATDAETQTVSLKLPGMT